ncbi:hypothetical protein FQN57_007020 [Myotisia sp. PD_48]|nr:hypothetical protein FQN57_007020 [Myotisia sp. PD_48]
MMELLQPVRYIPGSTKAECVKTKPMEKRLVERKGKVIMVYSKVYGIAKVVCEVLAIFGSVMDENSPTDIKYHITRVEAQLAQSSASKLLSATEDLFYTLHAKIDSEIRKLKLCKIFPYRLRHTAINPQFFENGLPDPSHIQLIFEACRCLLRSESVRGALNSELVRYQQANQICNTVSIDSMSSRFANNPVAYRKYVQSILTDPNSPCRAKWSGLNPICDAAPAMITATMAEKYRAVIIQQQIDQELKEQQEQQEQEERELREALGESVDEPIVEESDESDENVLRQIMANREAAYAMLHGIKVGDYRRKEGTRPIPLYIADKLCLCLASCPCARRCTVMGDRECPCINQMTLPADENDPSVRESLVEKCTDMGVMVFDRLCETCTGVEAEDLMSVLNLGLEYLHEEIVQFRDLYWKRSHSRNHSAPTDVECRYLSGGAWSTSGSP